MARTVAVAIRFDDCYQPAACREPPQQLAHVVADCAEVDLSPALRADIVEGRSAVSNATESVSRGPRVSGLDHEATALIVFMTIGISGSSSVASRPAEPCRACSRRPASACTYTPVTAAVYGSEPCAIRPAISPASTSPVPPLARAGTSCGSSDTRPSGAATTVLAPLRTTTASQSRAAVAAI